MQGALAGDVVDIDDEITAWHKRDGGFVYSLAEWLGMTREEYAGFIVAPDALPELLARRRVLATHEAAAATWSAHLEATIAASRAVDAFRAAVSAPTGKYWHDSRGEMVLRDLPAECNRYDAGDERCDDDAIAWSASGEARCAEHADDLEKNC